MKNPRHDRFLFVLLMILIVAGFIIFSSASLGLLSREGARFSLVAGKQLLILVGGIAVCLVFSRVPAVFWRRHALAILITSIIATLLVFVPKIGFSAGGAYRWLNLGAFSFQPSEFLKFGVVLFLASWFAHVKQRVTTWKFGVLPFAITVGIAGAILLAQPDMGTFMVIFAASLAVFFSAGPKWSHLFTILTVALLILATAAYFSPYRRERIMTFLDPSRDQHGSSYQIKQSLIAIGSGGLFGRGFGQSIQKFKYLPEPIGDSIFAVAGEEFGFAGTSGLILIFLAFGLWGLKIAGQTPDIFGRLLVIGIVIMVVSQAFANVAAMLGLIPLTGIPLAFVSHGGSALLIALAEMGIVLNISRQKHKSN